MKKFLIATTLLLVMCAPALALCGGKGILSGFHERRQARIDNRHSRREARHSTTSQTMTTTTRTTFRARGGVVMMSSGSCANGQCDVPQKSEKIAPPTKTK